MDTREVERYLARLYAAGDEFEVLYTQPDGQVARKSHRMNGAETVPEVLDEMQRAEAAGFNVYTSAMPRNVQASGKYDRIWVDQDDPSAVYPFAANEVKWPEPTTLVKTSDAPGGFRWQAIWVLTEPIDAALAKHAMKALSQEIGADETVHDARRVLRVPGLMNVKRGSAARLLGSNATQIPFSLFQIEEPTALAQLLNADVQNPNHVLGEFLDGVQEGDRNRKAYMAARHLYKSAVGFEDAGAILKLGASRCEPPMSDRELEHALASAYHRGTS